MALTFLFAKMLRKCPHPEEGIYDYNDDEEEDIYEGYMRILSKLTGAVGAFGIASVTLTTFSLLGGCWTFRSCQP